jgi:uncharacterized protein with NAD-binding domain and iron-sulfur cluster
MSTSGRGAEAGGRRSIAILGGGCGGLAAAWGLVNSERGADLDITVYQLGWRLGGKGASGRNAAVADRIEEHGLHIWGGMYENAFAIMRSVYAQLDRPPGSPLSVWYDPARPDDSAFLPHNNTTLTEFYNGAWTPWVLELPSDEGLPGDGRMLPTLHEYLRLILDVVEQVLFGERHAWQHAHPAPASQALHTPLRQLGGAAARVLDSALLRVARALFRFRAARHVADARRALDALPADPAAHTAAHHAAVHGHLTRLEQVFGGWFGRWIERHAGLRRVAMIVNLGAALTRGILEDGILEHGIDVVDDEEFTDWLRRHGASELTLNGALIRGWHDFFFAYVDGDGTRPSLSAASGLRTLFRYCFTYRGAFFWKMQAGMGDTIFTPLYQALRQKGVRFAFFHRVETLTATDEAGGSVVQSITIRRQVDLARGVTEYQPLVDVLGVDSWPSEPLYDQIEPSQAQRLREGDVDLESWWTDWPGVETITLERGRDFDDVILAIPPAAARYLTADLAARSPRWRDVLERIPSNQTIAAQVWLEPPLDQLGWTHGSTVGTVYANPFNTWANMDQLLRRERWGSGSQRPASVIYFCGTLTDAVPMPSFDDHGFPRLQAERIREIALTWLDANLGPLYPLACEPGSPQFRWSLLLPRSSGDRGEGGFSTQYWRINIDPSERYVLSVPGTARYRPRAHDAGFANLYLAGDWLRTGINAGCVEAAVMGGLQASQAMVGFPQVIIGDDL